MEASIDGYSQMRIGFSIKDLDYLEKEGRIAGKIWRFTRYSEPETIPLLVYVRDYGKMKAFSLPRRSVWEEKNAYVIRLIPRAIQIIKERRYAGIDQFNSQMRSVLMSLEDVF